MLANDLDRSVSRSESFIKEVEEKLEGLGHKVDLPKSKSDHSSVPSGKSNYSTDVSSKSDISDVTSSSSKEKEGEKEKEYVGWRQRMSSVYEIEIKDEKQLLDAIGKSREREANLQKGESARGVDNQSVLSGPEASELRRRRESSKLPSEAGSANVAASDQERSRASGANSCFEVPSAYEERLKEQSKRQKVSEPVMSGLN